MFTTARSVQAPPRRVTSTTGTDPLQRHALRDPLAAPVQRATFGTGLARESMALPSGLSYTGTGSLVDVPGTVNVYTTTKARQANKLAALTEAATAQAAVGLKIASYFSKIGFTKFTSDLDKFGIKAVKSMDPFIHRVSTSYGASEDPKTLTLDYQNSHKFTGYVIKVVDGASGSTSEMINDRPLNPTVNKGVPGNYSNVHADTGTNALSGLTTLDTNKTKDVNEEHIDAMTKIAGEGARWVAVRNHAAKLTDRSWFFIRTNNAKDPDCKGVSFRNLWLSWASAFDKDYNISDATFKSTLKNYGGSFNMSPGTAKLSACDGNDYDLDNSKSHTV